MKRKRIKSRIYLAGPMRGLPELNHPAFNREAARLRRLGWDVVNPVEVGEKFGSAEKLAEDDALLERLMRHELALLAECDAVLLLEGWEMSAGARRELQVALDCGLDLFVSRTGWRRA